MKCAFLLLIFLIVNKPESTYGENSSKNDKKDDVIYYESQITDYAEVNQV